MFGIYATNPDESLCASIAWTLWTEGRLATDLLAGALPGIEQYVYWTPPFYYLVLALWQGLWGPGLLAMRCLSLVLGLGLVVTLWQVRRKRVPAAWTASVIVLFDPMFQRVMSMGRMDMLAIALTTAALATIESGRDQRRCLLAGLLATAAFLTHPLGAAALVSVGLICLLGGRQLLLPFLVGSAPLFLGWAAYISIDVDLFLAQMQLQFAVKAGRALSPLGNLQRMAEFYGSHASLGVVAWIGGMAGLVLGRRHLLPWLIGAACLPPVIIFAGELVYPAYLAPFTAVGLCELLKHTVWGRRAVGVMLAVAAMTLASDRVPLAGVSPDYQRFCDYISAHIDPGSTVLLAILPDPWFGLRQRPDLELRLAPPVSLARAELQAYVARSTDVIWGGYNVPGFENIVARWDEFSKPGQQLWLYQGVLVNYDDVREKVRIRE